MALSFSAPLRTVSATVAAVLVAAGLALADPARADTAPAAGVTETVSTDPLPTVQVDGIVWSQVVVGNTVYVGGNFTNARPAGAAAGVNTTPRLDVLAYNLTTGELIPGFVANTNGQVNSVTAAPDGSRVYIGGTFSSVNGVTRYRVAALDPATGAVVPGFAPSFNGTVDVIQATASTLYAGGNFTAVGSATRTRGAAVSTANGALLPFAPVIEGGRARGIAVSPDHSKVVFAGSFTTLNGSSNPGYGMGAVDANTGASLPWAVNNRVRNAGTNAAIYSLTSDAQGVYGTGYHFGGGGNLEGAFKADWDGNLTWAVDCHGDTYSSAVLNGAIYVAGHPHYCSNVDGFPQTDPHTSWTFQRGMAYTTGWNGNVNGGVTLGYASWLGVPAPDLLNWWPDFNTGTVSGSNQGPWNVAAGNNYVVYGGEFTRVNNRQQQGLVRFATKDIAPNDDGPRLGAANFVPTLTSPAAGVVRATWLANYDRDNQYLTYNLYRDGNTTTPIYTSTVGSRIWFDRPVVSYIDKVAPGTAHTYRVRATDPYGNSAWGDPVSITASSSGNLSTYAEAVLNDNARNYWRLGESSGTTMRDTGGFHNATAGTGVVLGQQGAIVGDSNTAALFSGTSAGLVSSSTIEQGKDIFSVEAWFKTASTVGGKIVGFGNARTGNSGTVDRHVYLDGSGRIYFGVSTNARQVISSGAGYNNNQWHHVVATLGSQGMQLYVDGVRVASRGDVTQAANYAGYWRIGGDTTWAGAQYLAGTIDDVAVYNVPLTSTQVRNHYVLSGRSAGGPAAPTDTYGAAVVKDQPDRYWRLNDASAATSAADYSGNNGAGRYSGGVTKPVAGITADPGARFDGTTGLVSSATTFNNPRSYSLELWFRTNTTTGGKLIGFGNAQTGLSSTYDRHVYLTSDGRLVFGANTGTQVALTTANAYNDNQWHHVVATQGTGGMRLFVDGVLQGSNASTAAGNYTGYWRVGGDRIPGATATYVRADIDEVAIYGYAVSSSVVGAHYQASGLAAAPNAAPTAAFTTTVANLQLSADASTSADTDGTIRSYAWNFGDNTPVVTETDPTTEHTYASAGTYTVTLTVTDDDGATAQATRSVTVSAANAAPTAAFTSSTSGLTASVDASTSADSDGTIQSYRWNFGDSTPEVTATTPTSQHTYATAGTYTVTLTVTDDDGATATTTGSVTVTDPGTPPPPTTLASDDFARTSSSGWGTAPTGGAWTTSPISYFSTNGGVGRISIPTVGRDALATLGSVAGTSTDSQVTVSLQTAPTGGGVQIALIGRRVGSQDYRANVVVSSTGAVNLQVRGPSGALAGRTISGLTLATGEQLRVRLQVVGQGTTTLRAKVWKIGTTEPADWQVTGSDTTAALQTSGSVGIYQYLSGSVTTVPMVVTYDDLIVTAAG